jgi:hypothetical protein
MLLLAALAAGCSKPKGNASAPPGASQAEPTSAASAAPSASDAMPAANPLAHAPIDPSTLKPPPLTPPADAKAGEGGVHFQLLDPGTGDPSGPVDTLIVDFSMWTGDGKLAHSSYADPQSTTFSIARVSPQLRGMLAPLKKGARARYWLPRASLAGWKPDDWPDADLVIEVQVQSVTRATYRDPTGAVVEPVPFQPPDAAGPPGNALKTPSGLRFVYLAHGADQLHPKPATRLDLRIDAYAIDGLTVEPLESGLKSATTLERAPGNLGEVLTQLVNGDRVRVWLPMGVGRQVIPKAGSRDAVLDISVAFKD